MTGETPVLPNVSHISIDIITAVSVVKGMSYNIAR